ncbi:RHS repeat-associated core domain-containing protein, partial [Roseofilum sp. Guam]|uniref:RHS repeat-associated core domain-containing protein n=1 Tax=Roseofilum sp. Guam TaxID=2821502 RepID=UPI001B1974E5
DDNGNLLYRTERNETVNYVWDDRNRLVAVEENGERVEYEYDDDNIRVSQTVGGEKTSFLLDKNRPYAQVLAEFVGEEEVASYVYGLDLISQNRNGEDWFYFVDGLGSTRGLTDGSGEVTDAYWYDAYGNLVERVGSSENDYLFAGEQFDEALGQYYLRQRYYDASTGRFTRRDTWEGRLSEPVTLNKYLYGNGNPVSYTDPSGLLVKTQLSATLVILAVLAAMNIPNVNIDSFSDFNKKCEYTIEEQHLFYPDRRFGGVTGFHSTARADKEGATTPLYEWVTEPDEYADFEPFYAIWKIPGTDLQKGSSFFPIGFDEDEVLKVIGEAYEKKCIPSGAWSDTAINPITGETFYIQGTVASHHILTAFPSVN